MIVRVTGGLGNQMFQYAFKLELDHLSGRTNELDVRYYEHHNAHSGYELERVFQIRDPLYEGKRKAFHDAHPVLYKALYVAGIRSFKTRDYLVETNITYVPDFKETAGSVEYYDGYWQSQEYFAEVKEKVRSAFSFPALSGRNREFVSSLSGENTVSVHVRRGDYLQHQDAYVNLSATDYYESAVRYIKERVENPVFVVFSDDISWCREHLLTGEKALFVDWNRGKEAWKDMQLMRLCRHNIIANSSFSWWGAFLNDHPEKIVIAPKRFYTKLDTKHLVPKEWIRV